MTTRIHLARFSLGLLLALCACDDAAPLEEFDSDGEDAGLHEDSSAHAAAAEIEEHEDAAERTRVDPAGSGRCEFGAVDVEPEVFEVEPPARGLVEPRFRVAEDQAAVALRLQAEAEAYDAADPMLEE